MCKASEEQGRFDSTSAPEENRELGAEQRWRIFRKIAESSEPSTEGTGSEEQAECAGVKEGFGHPRFISHLPGAEEL